MDPSDYHAMAGRRRTVANLARELRPPSRPNRRRQSRLRVRLRATLETRAECHQAILADLSLDGARILSNGDLRRGTEVVLRWADMEAFGEVIWSGHNQCGIAFVEPVTMDAILATRTFNDTAQLPDDRAMLKQIAAQWVGGKRRL